MWRDLLPGAELAAAADALRASADRDEAAGLIPHWEGEARRSGAAMLEDWGRVAGEAGTR
jgi:hypothetical protein